MARLPKHRRPTTPGEILLHDVLEPMGMTQQEFANRLRVSYPRVNDIIHGRRSVTPDTALRIGRLLGSSPDVWLGLQAAVDLWDALQDASEELDAIEPLEGVA